MCESEVCLKGHHRNNSLEPAKAQPKQGARNISGLALFSEGVGEWSQAALCRKIRHGQEWGRPWCAECGSCRISARRNRSRGFESRLPRLFKIMASDITAQAGKGRRAHRNVSNPQYRAGWDRIFGHKRPKIVNTVSPDDVKNVLTSPLPDVKQLSK